MYKRIKFDIEGMHCPSCSYRLQKHLTKLNGVKAALVNLASASLVIEYDPAKISITTIEQEVKSMGYRPILMQPTSNLKNFYQRQRRLYELKSEGKKLVFGLIFLIPLLSLELIPILFNIRSDFFRNNHLDGFIVFQLFLSVPILILGWKIIENGWKQLLAFRPNVNSLVALSVSASFLYSLYSSYFLIWQQANPAKFPVYYLPACAILVMILLGRYLEDRITLKTKRSIRDLTSLLPDKAIRIENQQENIIDIERIEIGDLISITPGMRIPVDGIVSKGKGSVNEEIFSGNKSSVFHEEGDKVFAGTLNLNQSFILEVQKKANESFLSEIISLIEEGENSKPGINLLANKISSIVIQLILGFSVLSGGLWAVLSDNYQLAFKVFISVLMIACPVAIGLAIPISVLISTRRASMFGIIIRRIAAFESMRDADTFVFNMSGTLTKGTPVVTDISAKNGISAGELLRYAASAEATANHPLANAILAEAKIQNVDLIVPDLVRELPGMGIEAAVGEERVDIGNRKLMELVRVDEEELKHFSGICRDLSEQGKTTLMVAVDGVLKGIIATIDKPKKEAEEVIRKIHDSGKMVILLTGEHWSTARYIAHETGIQEIHAETQPLNRARFIRKLQHEGKVVVMIGDGVNDAGALAQANAGVAIGSPSDIGADAADIILLNTNLNQILTLMRLANRTVRNIKENLFFAFIYNLLMIPLAAGVLYIFNIHKLIDPVVAIAVMFIGSISVLLNGLRLRRFK
ncbi:MAG: heavy metal translocating P-type ATPase [Bacteroidales bacterium]